MLRTLTLGESLPRLFVQLLLVLSLSPCVAHAAPGDLDPSFGVGGKATTDFGGVDAAYALAIQADGKIVVAGSTSSGGSSDFALARYNPDGTLDRGFGPDGTGKMTTDFGGRSDAASVLAIQADGKIVVAGNTSGGGSSDFALARYNPDGTLDRGFGPDGTGKVTTDFSGLSDGVSALAIQTDGKIVAAGTTFTGSLPAPIAFALARYNADGSLDRGFGPDGTGKVTTNFGCCQAEASALAIQADGKIVAAGFAFPGVDFNFALARYNPDGTLDGGFGPDGTGKVTTDFAGRSDAVSALAIQADGKIVAAGSAYPAVGAGNDINFALARYNPDGTLDGGFGPDGTGKVTTDFGGRSDAASALAIEADGKIVVAGSTFSGGFSDFALARYNSDGTLDSGFGPDGTGKVTTDFGGADFASALAIQADGKIVVAGLGSFISSRFDDFALARYDGRPPNIVVNGSFETPAIAANTFQLFPSIPGWQLSFGCSIEIQSGVAGTPQDGRQFVELDSTCASGIFQDLPTKPGQVYELRFFFAPRPISVGAPGGVADNHVIVKWDGAVIADLTASGVGLPDTVWTEFVYRVPATSATTRLEFGDASVSDSFGTYIDNVRVGAVGHTVPPQRPIVFIPGVLGTHLKNVRNNTQVLGLEVSASLLEALAHLGSPCGGGITNGKANAQWVWPNLNRFCFQKDDLFLNQLALNESGTDADPVMSDPDKSGSPASIEVGDAGDGFKLTVGTNREQFIIEQFTTVRDVSQDDPLTFVYKGFLKFLNDRGYSEGSNTLRVFPYDWRLHFNDLRVIGRLNDTIDDLLRRSGQDRVDIIAHSNGGMVAKAYFAHYGRMAEAKVGRFIMVGTPHYGATKALKTLLFGENDFLDKLSPILDPNRLGIVARNSPQVYQTMPTERYVRDFAFPVVLETGCEVGGLQGGLVYSDLLRFLQFSVRDVTKLGLQLGLGPSAPFFNSDGTLSDIPLLNPNLDEWVAPHNGNRGWDAWEPQDPRLGLYLFIGYNYPTVEQIVFKPAVGFCDAVAIERQRGDGTVPAYSAEANGSLIGARRYYVDTDGGHLQMIKENQSVWVQIANILADRADILASGIALSPSLVSNSYFQVLVGSPAELHVYGAEGAHLGPNALGGIDRQVPRASYHLLGEAKVGSVEQGADYTVKVLATKLGLVALSIEEFRDDLSVGSINYPPLPIAEGSILSFQLKNLGDADALVFDSDGDGMPELTLSSRTAADPTTYAQLIIDVVRTVPLPVGIRQSLLAKVDAVFKSLQAGNPISAGGELNAYLNELRALRGNQIPSDTAEALTAFGTILRSLMP